MTRQTTTMTDDTGLSDDQKVAVALNDLPAAGLPEFVYTDGPNGIRGAQGATAFPSGLAVAASFDEGLAERFGEALARESLAAGRNAILAPGLDIARVPWGGRIAEALGEDPTLVGDIGAAIVRGIQKLGVLAVPKHFVANNFEYLRTGRGSLERRTPAIDVRISPRALREIYAEPFRRALLAGAGAVLSSYNRIGGKYVSENEEVLSILRDEWGWQGFVTPDFLHAVRDDLAALEAGLDFPALGGTANRTEEMVRKVGSERVDQIVRRTLWAVSTAGVAPAPPTSEPLDDRQSQDLAQEILEKGAVLLKNDGLLPLSAASATTVALVGIKDPTHLLVMGGSAAVTLTPSRITSVAESLREVGIAGVTVVGGTLGDVPLPTMPLTVSAAIRDDVSGEGTSLTLPQFELFERFGEIGEDWSATLTARYVPRRSGQHRFSLTFAGEATFYIDGRAAASGYREASPMVQGPEYPVQAIAELHEGQAVELKVDYTTGPAFRIPPIVVPGVKVGIAEPDEALREAVAAASEADVAVVIVGRVTGEAMDADSIRLPGDQEALIRAVAAANPRTVVVTCGAGPIVMPWAEDVSGLLHVWNPGERFGPALARMLVGLTEPGGRLPLTFPAAEERTPVSTPEQYPGVNGTTEHTEDLLIGYRWYQASGQAPLFPFGHGLGYTHFGLHDMEITAEREVEGSVTVSAAADNIGSREGDVVMQVYVTSPAPAGEAVRVLKGFARASVPRGGTERVSARFALRDLAAYDADDRLYRVLPGTYSVEIGTSSAQILLRADLHLEERVYRGITAKTGADA